MKRLSVGYPVVFLLMVDLQHQQQIYCRHLIQLVVDFDFLVPTVDFDFHQQSLNLLKRPILKSHKDVQHFIHQMFCLLFWVFLHLVVCMLHIVSKTLDSQ